MRTALLRRSAAAVSIAIGSALAVIPAGSSIASAADDESSLATFEGEVVDLRDGWGEATACHVDDSGTTCYRTHAELDEAYPMPERGDVALAFACSSTLRLYSNTSYGGSLLQLSTQGVIMNLSAYGFSNVTSSYKVGACKSTFYDGFGTGVYPGNTLAFAQSPVMLAGWDNRISSVYIS